MTRAGDGRPTTVPGAHIQSAHGGARVPRALAVVSALVIVSAIVAACGGDGASTRPTSPGEPTSAPSEAGSPSARRSALPSAGAGAGASERGSQRSIRVQLQWLPQAQFAGYYAAKEQGYFDAAGLDVTFVTGGPDVAPQVVGSAPNGPEFTISWVPKVLAARERQPASDLVDIAQIFQRSGTLTVAWRESGITSPADFKGKQVALWSDGNDLEVTAALAKAGLEPGTDYRVTTQRADMSLFLAKRVDVAQAMIYNEYAQVLEASDATGAPYQPTDLDTINYNDEGTAMLQDAVFARAAWLSEPGSEGLAIGFLRASFQGWIYCRDNPDDCVGYTVNAGATLGADHQAWMLNEVNPLIWPSPAGIGIVDRDSWQQTVDVALGAGIIRTPPAAGAYRTDLAEAALTSIAELTDLDVEGESFQKRFVEIAPGG
jgi:NitT/TauT family transport system substrate-binding protein